MKSHVAGTTSLNDTSNNSGDDVDDPPEEDEDVDVKMSITGNDDATLNEVVTVVSTCGEDDDLTV